MNRIVLSGNLCKDIELKKTKSDKSYTENTIAVRKNRKDKDGNYSSDFIDFVCFETISKYLKDYSKKGDKIELEGQLRVDNWKDDEGKSHTKVYVVVDRLNILTARNTNEKVKDKEPVQMPFEITDDDLPF